MANEEPPSTPGSADVRVSWDAGAVKLELVGELDIANHDVLRNILDVVVARGRGDVRVDAAAVRFCDAGVVGILIETRKRLHADGRRILLHHVTRPMRRVLELADATWLLDPGDQG